MTAFRPRSEPPGMRPTMEIQLEAPIAPIPLVGWDGDQLDALARGVSARGSLR